MRDCILYFVKYPQPGAVKTRMAEGTTPQLAADFYRAFAADKFAEIVATPEAEVIVCFAPEKMQREVAAWLPCRRYLSQKGTELGRRMENAFGEAFLMGYDRAVLVGSDIPGLTPDILRRGLNALAPDTAVLGPAEDGGYYLIGFHRQGFKPEVLRNMAWSDSHVFQRTADLLNRLGLDCVELERLADMDTLDDLAALVKLGADGPLAGLSLETARAMTDERL